MTVTLPANGKADWTDYVDYWREADAEWLQDRIILRTTNALRAGLAQSAGGVVYNSDTDLLELKQFSGSYLQIRPLPSTLTTSLAAGVTTISSTGAAGKGIGFHDTTGITITDALNVMAGTLVVVGGGSGYVGIKSGVNLEGRLTTVGTTAGTVNLVSSVPMTIPALTLSGTGTVLSTTATVSVGTLSAATGTFTSNVGVSGALTAASGTIGSVVLASNKVTASNGFDTSGGSFYGDGGSAIVRNVARTGAYFQAGTDNVIAGATNGCYMHSLLRVQGAAARIYHEATGKNFAPSFYSASDPGVGNYPEGTIWIS